MESRIYDLLYSVPDNADYAVDAADLDAEDIPQNRIDGLMGLLLNGDDCMECFLAAKLLASWGVREGLVALDKYIDNLGAVSGLMTHRLHGYDDTYRCILLALTSYFANMSDKGESVKAREEIYNPISKIIELSNTAPFEISDFFWLVEAKGFFEYIPLLREHLVMIFDRPDVHYWKINDVVKLLLKVDLDFVSAFLKGKGRAIEDFK
ncbi:hypothetical protein HNR03_000998 [Pseudomonas sp. JAI111]|uniref:hypothetical protein n=1 Tax=Pseudomonas sp. JAI111 TaxID=2735913 RepID=UPI002169E748|nr:hypothetical protein [Pseudomonas sp. JAI111]MCS3836418.1 hypothetical protein [Pseudomonas sp. JAI111]